MKYMLLIYLDEKALSEADRSQCYKESTQLAHQLSANQQFLATAPLHPTSTATTVRVQDGKTQVLNGPYAEVKEQLGGYFLIDAPDPDAAISWAARCPGAQYGAIEVRPIWEM